MIPLCIAHRGASIEAPENTLRAFERALDLGADGIELDARTTRDGVAVVFHDENLRRLSGSAGRIEELGSKELGRFPVRGEPIPLLADALAIARGRAIVQIEIKKGAQLEAVLRAIRRTRSSDHVILASFELPVLRAAAQDARAIPRMLIANRPKLASARRSAMQLLRTMASVGASGISVDHRAVASAVFVETIRLHGARLWCWTVDDADAQRRLCEWEVDAVLTNDPAGWMRRHPGSLARQRRTPDLPPV